jgi:hypothetical protein
MYKAIFASLFTLMIKIKIKKNKVLITFGRKDVDTEIRRALDVWSSYTQLNFEQRESGRVHIDIR